MKLACRIIGIIAIVAVACCGCGHKTTNAPAPPAARKATIPLPSWAPKNPSKEFLRAARVLKPIPAEAEPYSPMHLAAWEFFGSLTDAQIAAFQKREQVSLPVASLKPDLQEYMKTKEGAREVGGKLVYNTHQVWVDYKSFTPQQRKAFDGMVKAWSEAARGDHRDLLVLLYKLGAKKDLSNVHVGFHVSGGHAVHITIGATGTTGAWIAQF